MTERELNQHTRQWLKRKHITRFPRLFQLFYPDEFDQTREHRRRILKALKELGLYSS
jgi:hypothetical protein